MHIDPFRPFADAILFDDLFGIPLPARNRLAARGVVFGTAFRAAGSEYGGNIIAASWQEAERIAFGRGLGEEIIGVLVETGAGDPPDWVRGK
jgi:hypothetical protein